ncbi:MAG: PAS domain S-box protein [Planctomycetota bacterium]|jgi:PAS domain S-box-containing protein
MAGSTSSPDNANGATPTNAAIVGGGKGCKSILEMVQGDTLGQFRMRVLGVADIDAEAIGIQYARELGVPLITTDYRELYEIPGLRVIIELTGDDAIRDEMERTRPRHVRLIDHYGARLFWEIHQAEETIILGRTEMQKKVEAERERIAEILDSIPDEIVVVDTDMLIQDANSSFLRNNNCSIGDIRGLHCYDIEQGIRGECQVCLGNCPFSSVMKEGRPTSLVRKHFGRSGEIRYASIVGAPLRDREGRITGMIEIIRDITHRMRLKETLATTEVHLQQLMELAPLATYAKNHSGQYINVNPAACVLFGKEKEELLGKTDLELFPRETAEMLREGEQEVWQKRVSVCVETELMIGDRRIFLSTVNFPILNSEGNLTALCALSEDVTAQKEAEKELRETREYLQNILDNSPVIIITTDMHDNIVSFNRGAERSLGYRADEVIGKPITLLYRDPAKQEEFLRLIMSDKAVQDYSFELLCKDGTLLPVSLSLSQLKNSSGTTIGTVGMSKDISHRKALMAQILQSERLAAVGRLASGVAHEINNPLAIISEITGFLNELTEDESEHQRTEIMQELKEALPKIRTQIERGREITHRLLQFARKTEMSIEHADVNTALKEILPFLEKECRLAGITIHRDCQRGVPKIALDETQLQEILMNLTKNAIDALKGKGGGNIWLEAHEEEGKVVISLRDDGPGIDDAIRDRLFDPFASTKSIKQGTGLGLAICYAIVKRCDGEIRVFSEPDGGACFKVFLPAHNPASKTA